jgi:hypothetical protein
MRTLIGLCFLTTTLLASSANAQGIFIEQGDPSAVSIAVGSGMATDGWGLSAAFGYSYRGVFDIRLDAARDAFTSGDNLNLAGYLLTPSLTWHAIRTDVSEWMPFSVAFTLGIEKHIYSSDKPGASPDGWGVLMGVSVYRRFTLGNSLVLAPEIFSGDSIRYERLYSEAGNRGGDGSHQYRTKTDYYNGTEVLRVNVLFKVGSTVGISLTPYAGYMSRGVALKMGFCAGGTLGAVF